MSDLNDLIIDASQRGAERALAAHQPKLTRTRAEAAAMLQVSIPSIDRMLADGRLEALIAGKVTLASILRVAGWPVVPAPMAAPVSSIPSVDAER